MMGTAHDVVTYRTLGFTFWAEAECTFVLTKDGCVILGESTLLLLLVPGSLHRERSGEGVDGE